MKLKRKRRFTIPAGELWLGDCLKLAKQFPAGMVDMVFADLPYGTTSCKWDSIIPFEDLWAMLRHVCKPGAPMIFTACQPFTSALIMSNPKEFKVEWVWKKNRPTGFLNAKKQPLRDHESVLVFYSKQCVFNPQLTEGSKYRTTASTVNPKVYRKLSNNPKESISDKRYPVTCPLSFLEKWKRNGERHPTQKPVALVEYFIKTYSNRGALIFDPTFGSGTTAVAAANCRRKFVGCENDSGYFFKALERVSS